MKTIYIDSDFKLNASNEGYMTTVETGAFVESAPITLKESAIFLPV